MEHGNRKILVYRPAQATLAVVVIAVLLATAAYMLFDYGQRSAGLGMERLTGERDELEKNIGQLREVNHGLREQLAVLERSSEIDRRASREVRNEFAELKGELLELRKDLAFYQGIVSPGETEPGLRIQRVHLEPVGRTGRFFYSLMLTQVKRNERYVRGVIEMDVEGLQDGSPKSLSVTKLAEGNIKVLKYKFRYFQNFEGEIKIPEGFQPQKVRIRLKPQGKGQPPGIEKTVEWPA